MKTVSVFLLCLQYILIIVSSCMFCPPLVIMIPWEKSRLQTILMIEPIRLKEYETNRGPSHLRILILEIVSVLYDHVVSNLILSSSILVNTKLNFSTKLVFVHCPRFRPCFLGMLEIWNPLCLVFTQWLNLFGVLLLDKANSLL